MEAELWKKARGGCEVARGELIIRYTPLVGYVVGRLRTGIPPWVTRDDLVSFGNLGLIDSVKRFDPDLGFQFTTYAVRRIRGAIMDELRKEDWAPRDLRPDARALASANEKLLAALGREPTPVEVADELEWPLAKVDRVLADVSRAMVDSIEGSDDDEEGHHYISPPASQSVGEQRMEEIETLRRIADAMGLLDAQERALMALYYFEQMNFGDIAALLGVTESRVCQIYARAMANLRELSTV